MSKSKLETAIREAILAPQYESENYVDNYLKFHMIRFIETTKLLQRVIKSDTKVIDVGTYGSLVPVLTDILNCYNITCSSPIDGSLPQRQISSLTNAINGEKYKFVLDKFDIEENFPYADESFDVVIFTEVLEHISIDPMHTLKEINRITKMGGYLVISTPNCASSFSIIKILKGENPYTFPVYTKEQNRDRHNREYVANEVFELLKASGYTVMSLMTKDVYNTSRKKVLATKLLHIFLRVASFLTFNLVKGSYRGDSIFALAKKTNIVIERYPSFLYYG